MAKVYCYKELCTNRSKRKSKFTNTAGDPLYRCLLEDIVIINYIPGDEEYYGDSKVCECLGFKLRDDYEKENGDID